MTQVNLCSLLAVLSYLTTAASAATCCSNKLYYVKAPGGAPCPTNTTYTCQDLSHYTSHSSLLFTSNAVFWFLDGHHTLDQEDLVMIHGVSNLTIQGSGTMEPGPHKTAMQSSVIIKCTRATGGFLFFNSTSITVAALTFTGCAGQLLAKHGPAGLGPILAEQGPVSLGLVHMYNTHLQQVSIQNASGFGLLAINSFNFTIENSSFYRNQYTSKEDKGMHSTSLKGNAQIIYSDLYLDENSLSLTSKNTLEIIGTSFSFSSGSGLNIFLSNMEYSYRIDILIDTVTAYANTGSGNLNINISSNISNYMVTINNTRSSYGHTVQRKGAGLNFEHASINLREGKLWIHNSSFSHNCGNVAGGMYLRWIGQAGSVVLDNCTFHGNSAQNVSALYVLSFATHSKDPLISLTNVIFDRNQILNAQYKFQSVITLDTVVYIALDGVIISNNPSTGLSAFSSVLLFTGQQNIFSNNSGIYGGGMALYWTSHIVLERQTLINFTANHADYHGGGLYIIQMATPGQPRCFFQTKSNTAMIFMSNNTAGRTGTAIYGGEIESCFPYSGFDTVFNISDSSDLSVSSDVMKLCLCNEQSEANCSTFEYNYPVAIPPGKTFSFPIIALGNKNGLTTASVTAYSSFLNSTSSTNTSLTCKNLSFTLKIKHPNKTNVSVVIDLRSGTVQSRIYVTIPIRQCPHGFEFNETSGTCNCSAFLKSVVENISCDINTETFARTGKPWIGYDNETDCVLASSSCPADYCKQGMLNFTLDDPDAQCDLNRSGVLCGHCAEGLGSFLASDGCGECDGLWYLYIIPALIVRGILIIVILLSLNLTVSVGAINGLNLYVNLVQNEKDFFFPRGPIPVLSQYFAWIDLDYGIDFCFSNRETAYIEAWIRYAFVAYMFLILLVIVVCARFSKLVLHMVGSQIVPVLATLMFFLNTNLLQSSVRIYYIAYCETCSGEIKSFWHEDTNIPYFSAPHVPLVLVASLVFIFVNIPYIIFLLASPLIEAHFTGYKYFRWMIKLKPIMDAYGGPYNDRYRAWTGFLVLIRMIFILVTSLSTNVFARITVLMCTAVLLLTIHSIAREVYKKWYLNVLEMSFLFNLVLLIYFGSQSGKSIDENISYVAMVTLLSISLLMFFGIVLYHLHLRLKPKLDILTHCKKYKQKLVSKIKFKGLHRSDTANETDRLVCAQITHQMNNQYRESLLAYSNEDY